MITTTAVAQSLADCSVATLAQEARRNTARYLKVRQPHDDPHALELFRRAIAESDQGAWTALYDLYHALVRTWVYQHLPPAYAEAGESLVNDAFFRLFHAIDATRFCQFPSALGLLVYLHACAKTAVSDYLRSRRSRRAEETSEDLNQEVVLADPADEVMAQAFASEVWEIIGASVNERERLVLQVICVLGWPARTLPRLYPELFPTVKVVYSTKRAVLERLRHNPRLQAYRTADRHARSDGSIGLSRVPSFSNPTSTSKGAMLCE